MHKSRFLSMKNAIFFFFISVFLLLDFSCREKITPAYLILKEEDFKDCIDIKNYNSTHDASLTPNELSAIADQTFTAVLVSLNGRELGYWKPPCKIPLLPDYSKENNIRLIPCVRVPASTFTVEPYYFVSAVEKFFPLEEEGEYRFPKFELEYVPSVTFPILDIFDDGTEFKPNNPGTFPTKMEIYNDSIDLKKSIGKIVLSDSIKYFDVVTDYFPLMGRGERHFLEIKYKSIDGTMYTHLNFKNSPVGVTNQDLGIYPASEGRWQTGYFNISEWIQKASYTDSKIMVRLQITGIKNDEKKQAEFYFDHIKVITMTALY